MSKVSEKLLEKSEMSELVFASRMMQGNIAPIGSAGSKGERISLAAQKLRWKLSRTKSVWYADERVSLKPRELRTIEELTGVKYGQEELRTNDDLIAKADALLDGPEADFYRPFVTAFRAMARAFDRTRIEG